MTRLIGPAAGLVAQQPGAPFATLATGPLASVLDLPIAVTELPAALLGAPVVFEAGAPPHDMPVPIPHLPGLDAIEIATARFSIASAPHARTQAVAATAPAAGGVAVALAGVAPGQTVRLTAVALVDLALTPPEGLTYALTGRGQAVYWWRDAQGRVVSGTATPGGPVQHLHILVRPGSGTAAGPPIAAAPHFAMPGAGGGLYGPALGGASLALQRHADGRVEAVLALVPPQPMAGCTVLVGTAAEGSAPIGPHAGLPTDLRSDVGWSARLAEGRFDVRAQGIAVTAHAGATPPEAGALVAQFDTDPGAALRTVDFAPAARAALTEGYPTAAGPDLGLTLRVRVAVPGALHLRLGAVAARYVQRPLPVPATLALRGAPEGLAIPLPAGLRPQGISFRVDGRFGPARLIADADQAPEGSRRGLRVAGPRRVARRLLLSPKEASLPLARLALFGRASEAGEILIARHGGDAARIGPALGPPVACSLAAADRPSWHRVEIGLRDGLPPHPPAVWLVVQATRGVFWWHAEAEAALAPALASDDGGTTWDTAPHRPLAQGWVREVDPVTGDPAPLAPLALGWANGVLNADIVGVGAGPLPPDFSRLWLAGGAADAGVLDGIAALPGALALRFHATRDVDLSLADVALSYDPWTARGAS